MPDLEIPIANSSIVHVFQSQNYFWRIEPYLEIEYRGQENSFVSEKVLNFETCNKWYKTIPHKEGNLNFKTQLPFQAWNFN